MTHPTVDVVAFELLGDHRVRLEFAKIGIDAELGVLCWPNGADIDAALLRYDDLWRQQAGLADVR